MATFDWNESFETGLPEVDRQHAHLVEIINRFGDLQSQRSADKAELAATFRKLSNYAREHFRDEEALMTATGVDPRHIERHHREHGYYMEELNSIDEAFSRGDDGGGARLLKFLNRWLAHHILGQDHSMARQIAAIAAGQTPAEAFETEEHRRDSATDPLLNALNSLFEELSERNRELHQLNHTLEARVAERTQALMEANKRLEMLATTDTLTSLPNRRRAMTALALEWAATGVEGRHLSCLLIDADGFKEINDRYGHD
ncbi:MAG: GGDEF domain-containing protein, partial [Betaproteobacteria bacterium]